MGNMGSHLHMSFMKICQNTPFPVLSPSTSSLRLHFLRLRSEHGRTRFRDAPMGVAPMNIGAQDVGPYIYALFGLIISLISGSI